MAERHTIETYGRAPHNRNIWSTATERHTIETYGRAPHNRLRNAWPILLSVLIAALISLLRTHFCGTLIRASCEPIVPYMNLVIWLLMGVIPMLLCERRSGKLDSCHQFTTPNSFSF